MNSGKVSASAISTMTGYVARRSNVCVKVIDRGGKVVAVNSRGLELLAVKSEDICAQVWTEFWTGKHKIAAEAAVENAFGGTPDSFTGTFYQGAENSIWEVEVFPLEWDGREVSSILALSCRLVDPQTEAEDPTKQDVLEKFSEALHAMSNLASISASSARLLTRTQDHDMIAEIARGLEDAAKHAVQTTASLKSTLSDEPAAGN